MRREAKLWFDETVFLDSNSGAQANEWALPAEKYLKLGNANKASLTFEYFGVGAGAGSVDLTVQATSALVDVDDAFADLASSGDISRGGGSIAMTLGLDGGETVGYPKGMARVKLSNSDASNWASVRIRAWVELFNG